MTHALLVGFGIACVALGFIAAWILRSREASVLKRQYLAEQADAESAITTSLEWTARAMAAEAELARLPKRVAGGQFAKRT